MAQFHGPNETSPCGESWKNNHRIPVKAIQQKVRRQTSAITQPILRPRLPGLTSLRFFAAFLVVLFHLQSMQITLGPAWFRELSSIGYVGVSFFFVLSGFILVYTCQGKSVNVMKFWRTRFARIYPAYVFSLLLMAPWFFYAATKLKFPLFAWATVHLKSASLLSNDAHPSLGSRKRARVEFRLLEPLRRIIFLFVVSAPALGFRAKVARPFVVLHSHVLDSRPRNFRHLSVAEARWPKHHKFRSDQRVLAERFAI